MRLPITRYSLSPLGLFLALLAGAVLAGPSPAADGPAAPAGSVVVYPAALHLRHHRQPHALQVLGTSADGYSLDLRPQAKFTSAARR